MANTTDYANLINKGGTIYDTKTGVGFSSEAELREARNITAPTEWSKIPKNDAWEFSGSQTIDTWAPGYVGTGVRPETPLTPDDLAGGTLPSELALGDTIDNADDIMLNLSGAESITEIEEEIRNVQQEMLDEYKGQKEEKKTMFEKLGKQRGEITAPDTQALYEQTLSGYGWTPEQFQEQKDLIGKISEYNTKIAQIDALTQQKLSAAEQETVSLRYMQGRQALITRQAAVEKSGLAAQAGVLQMEYDMLRGNFTDAQGMADRVVNAATQEYQQNIQDFDAFSNLYQDYISSLSESDQQIINVAYQANVDALKTKKDDLTQKLNLKLQAAQQGIKLPFDINTTTLEEATDMYATQVGIKEAADKAATGAKEYAPSSLKKLWLEMGGEDSGISFNDFVMQQQDVVIPKSWSDDELRSTVRQMQADDVSYQSALDEISMNPNVLNKERARQIIAELYGQTEAEPEPEKPLVYGPPAPSGLPGSQVLTTGPVTELGKGVVGLGQKIINLFQ